MAKKRTRTRTRTTKSGPAVSPVLIGIIGLAAVLIVVGLIILGNQSRNNLAGPVDTSAFPAAGSPEAPVTIIEYGDYG